MAEEQTINIETDMPPRYLYIGNRLKAQYEELSPIQTSLKTILLFSGETMVFPGQVVPVVLTRYPYLTNYMICREGVLGVTHERNQISGSIVTLLLIKEKRDMNGRFILLTKAVGTARVVQTFGYPMNVDGGITIASLEIRKPRNPLVSIIQGKNLLHCKKNHMCIETPWPAWVHDKYNLEKLSELAKSFTRYIKLGNTIFSTPQPVDPSAVCYWFAKLLPLSDDTEIELLSMDVVPAFHCLLRYWEKFAWAKCSNCKADIAKREDIVAMSNDGPCNLYNDESGDMVEIVTYSQTKNMLPGHLLEICWFPGYFGRLCKCAGCDKEVGYLFKHKYQNFRPIEFWAIKRKDVSL